MNTGTTQQPAQNFVMRHLRLGQWVYTLQFGMREDANNEMREVSLELPLGAFSYGGIVATLVNLRYPSDMMQAVVNNYLLDPADAENSAEFADMQQWRAEAKTIAKAALAFAEKQGWTLHEKVE